MQAKGFNHYVIFIASAFAASMYASVAMIFDTTSEIAIATSVLYLIPGVPLINGVIDIVEGHVLNGIARLTSALMLIVCIAVGLSCTLMIVKTDCYDAARHSFGRIFRRGGGRRIRSRVRSSDAGLSGDRPAGRRGACPAFLPDGHRRGYRFGVAVRFGGDRYRKPAAGRPHPLPDDGAVHPRAAADDPRHVCLQDGLFDDYVHAESRRSLRRGVSGGHRPQRIRYLQRDFHAGRGSRRADFPLQQTRTFADTQ